MAKLLLICGAVIIGAFVMSVDIAGAMPGRLACSRGMPFLTCFDKCVRLGGVSRYRKEIGCARRCRYFGCR